MKNPIRNVVVEYKNRRARKSGNSLWGNLDLKSIAREVEEDSKASPSVEHAEPATPQINSKPVETMQEVAPLVDTIAEPATLETTTPSQVIETPPAVDASTLAVSEKKNAKTERSWKPLAAKPVKAKLSPRAKLDILDELQALDAENIALKRQLAEMLIAENEKMRRMLQRIDTQIEL